MNTFIVLSFYPLLLVFFLAVVFRLHLISNLFIYILILWLYLAPFILIFVDQIRSDPLSQPPKEDETN
ncbi:hypothetical protein JOD43_000172 [Pullulanibacillus pueri]|uniref:Uncharacterized protein n=1 Tax=Pullulanibacillus pueri TaxID=1437324 RepID=A0A8J2ZQX0_9BACL|nr:hypothetical protein [Pullulanibacillus pueri]MBM7680013.1 hypothetical protein [Pullulanibacillus pueri]GGH73939.1 hypothetical protein GCM10007096_01670 [Pullulanibacillus pueri]